MIYVRGDLIVSCQVSCSQSSLRFMTRNIVKVSLEPVDPNTERNLLSFA